MSIQPPLAYPHPANRGLHRPPPSDIHETAGIPGNWALDFMAPGGTPFLAPQDSIVTRFSGHDPAQGVIGGDIFGWSMYLRTSGRVLYFATHLGHRAVSVGQKVRKGDLLGTVGDWPHDPGRSHTHLGVSFPFGGRLGRSAAVARINAVAKAPMLPFPPL